MLNRIKYKELVDNIKPGPNEKESPRVEGHKFSSTLSDYHQVRAKQEKTLNDSQENFEQSTRVHDGFRPN